MTAAVHNVPVAADGTYFGPHLARRGNFTVGDKKDEQKFRDFEIALKYLKKQPVARWRRPNNNRNWGIVTAVSWENRSTPT